LQYRQISRVKNTRRSYLIEYLTIFVYKIKTMITINQEQIKELEAFINTIPTAYGLPLLQFLGKLNAEQNPPQETTEA
jgi:hypothetical protein